jgi:SAM-dependent methyltransferase
VEPDEYARMDRAEARMWWYRALHVRVLEALRPAHGVLLDAGCGTGGLLAALARARPDLQPVGLEWAEAAARRAASKVAAPVVRGSVNDLPFASGSFDAATLADVLCHAAVRPDVALAELRRVLRPGGLLVVNMPAYDWLLSAHDRRVHNVRRSTRSQLRALLAEAGFAPQRARYWNGLLLPAMVARRKLLSKLMGDRRNSASDVAVFSPWLDATFAAVTEIEHRLPFALPAGGSVLASARRL